MSETLHSIMQSNKFTLCRRRTKPVPLNDELVTLYRTVTSAHLNLSKIIAQLKLMSAASDTRTLWLLFRHYKYSPSPIVVVCLSFTLVYISERIVCTPFNFVWLPC